MRKILYSPLALFFVLAANIGCLLTAKEKNFLVLQSTQDWKKYAQETDGVSIENGVIAPVKKKGVYRSRFIAFPQKRSVQSITLSCSPKWDNWQATPKKSSTPHPWGRSYFFGQRIQGLLAVWPIQGRQSKIQRV
jgi:hypothetical protein